MIGHRTIFDVHLRKSQNVLSVFDELEVAFVPRCCSCQSRARKSGQWMEVQAVNHQQDPPEDNGGTYHQKHPQRRASSALEDRMKESWICHSCSCSNTEGKECEAWDIEVINCQL